MNNGGKIVVTILLIVGFFVVGIFLSAAGSSKSFIGLLALGLYFGIKAMWKKTSEESENRSEIKLNKNKDNSLKK